MRDDIWLAVSLIAITIPCCKLKPKCFGAFSSIMEHILMYMAVAVWTALRTWTVKYESKSEVEEKNDEEREERKG